MSDHSVQPFPLYLVQKTNLGGNHVPLTYDCCKTHLKPHPFQKSSPSLRILATFGWQRSPQNAPSKCQLVASKMGIFPRGENNTYLKPPLRICVEHQETKSKMMIELQELPMLLKKSYQFMNNQKLKENWCHYLWTHSDVRYYHCQ